MNKINYLEMFIGESYNTDMTDRQILALALAKIVRMLSEDAGHENGCECTTCNL